MASTDGRAPVRATYTNLYKWPESDAEFVRLVSSKCRRQNYPHVVDSMSCRQLYLRSYTFSRRRESVAEKTRKCLGRVRERVTVVARGRKRKSHGSGGGGGRKCAVIRRAKEVSLFWIFRRLLSCTTKVDVIG